MSYTKQQWYTPAEVAIHNQSSDCWVSVNGLVYDVTSWLQEQFQNCRCVKTCSCAITNWYCNDCVEYCPCFKQGYFYCDGKRLAMTVVANAGKDLSYWFKDGEWVRQIHAVTGTQVTYRTHGHAFRRPIVPSPKWRKLDEPWWCGDKYVVGKASAKTRPIRITNTLTGSTVTLEVCSEETIYEIMMRYLPHNSHLMSYTWRYMGKGLCLNKTLEENGIPDERDRFSDVALPENIHIPAILIYYNDDLTEGPSTGMESTIIVEGFKKSIEMHNLIYGRIISDGDGFLGSYFSIRCFINTKSTFARRIQGGFKKLPLTRSDVCASIQGYW